MTPYERLLAEAIPTRPPPVPPPRRDWTDAERDAHWAALCASVDSVGERRPTLRLIADAA